MTATGMKKLDFGDLAGAQEQETESGVNLPRETRKELLKMRISTLATSIIAMTDRALKEANQVGAPGYVAAAARAAPTPTEDTTAAATTSAHKTRRRSSSAALVVIPVEPAPPSQTTQSRSKRSNTAPRNITPSRTADRAKGSGVAPAPSSAAKSGKMKSSKSHKRSAKAKLRGGSPPAAKEDDLLELGPDGVSPSVEGASFEEVVRTLKALESPRDAQQEGVTRQLRWPSVDTDRKRSASPEAATAEAHVRNTEEQFQVFLASAGARQAPAETATDSENQLAAMIKGNLLYDRCVALSTHRTSEAPAQSPEAVSRPLTVHEVTASLHKLAGSGGDGDEVDEVESMRANPKAATREPRYYEVIYMLHRTPQSHPNEAGKSADKEEEEVDANEHARRQLGQLYAKSVFAAAASSSTTDCGTTDEASSPAAHPGDSADDEDAAQQQYQVAVMDLLQSSTWEPVRIPLGPLSSVRAFTTTSSRAASRYGAETSIGSATPTQAPVQTRPNSSETVTLMPSAGRRTRDSLGRHEHGSASLVNVSRSLDASEGFTRCRSDPNAGTLNSIAATLDADDECGGDADDDDGNASGANLAIRRIETWQKHREDVVASRIVNRRRSSVSGLALPTADFYYTSSAAASAPGPELAVRRSSDLPPAPAGLRKGSSAGAEATLPAQAIALERKTSSAHAGTESDTAMPTISSPSWTASSGPRGGALSPSSQPSKRQLRAASYRRTSAAVLSVSSVTTTTGPANSSTIPASTVYDVLLSTAVHPSSSSAGTVVPASAVDAVAVENGSASAGLEVVTGLAQASTPPPRAGPGPSSALDVIVASDYLTTPHLQMIWLTEEATQPPPHLPDESHLATRTNTPDDSAQRRRIERGEAVPPTQLRSVDTSTMDGTLNSLERDASSAFAPSPLGPPIVLC